MKKGLIPALTAAALAISLTLVEGEVKKEVELEVRGMT